MWFSSRGSTMRVGPSPRDLNFSISDNSVQPIYFSPPDPCACQTRNNATRTESLHHPLGIESAQQQHGATHLMTLPSSSWGCRVKSLDTSGVPVEKQNKVFFGKTLSDRALFPGTSLGHCVLKIKSTARTEVGLNVAIESFLRGPE